MGQGRVVGQSPGGARPLPAVMWLAGAPLMASLIVVATAGLGEPGELCKQPALRPGVVVSLPGTNLILPCLEGELENTSLVHWSFKGRNLSSHRDWQLVAGSNLFLPSVYFNDSGQYKCHAGNRILRSLQLLVEEPPEMPDFTCFRRSFGRDALCEWKPSRPMSPSTKAKLWVRKRIMGGNGTEQPCRYYPKAQKFTCRIQVPHDENNHNLLVSMCVANSRGSIMSQHKFYTTNSLLKPDPPANVLVTAVEKCPRKLLVSWRYPSSWGTSTFYILHFQIQYRANISLTYTEVNVRGGSTSYEIEDAVQKTLHVVQVRGCEEFKNGNWSEWSRESIGIPWSEPKEIESEETRSYITKFPVDYYLLGTNESMPVMFHSNTEQPEEVADAVPVPLPTFLIVSGTVTLGIALVAGALVRYRMKWRLPFSLQEKPRGVPSHSLVPLAASSPLSTSPLLSPPVSPCSESSADTPTMPEQSPYDVFNADYFLLAK